MIKKDILEALATNQSVLDKVENKEAKKILYILYNHLEEVFSEYTRLTAENQTLKDEINRLKGEQGKPDIKANSNKDGDISSEQARKGAETVSDGSNREGFKIGKLSLEKLKENRIPVEVLELLKSLIGKKYSNQAEFVDAVKSAIGNDLTEQYIELLTKYARYKKRDRSPKLPEIHIDREEECIVDTTQLPKDVVYKGYKDKIVQDLIIKTDNVKFRREMYYSASMNKIWLGDVPVGYEGDYGPHINSDIISMKYVNNIICRYPK